MRRVALAFAAALVWHHPAWSVSLEDFSLRTGNDLVDLCAVSDDDPLYDEAMSFCFGFFSGAMHFHRALVRGPDIDPFVCPKRPVSRAEAIAVFLDWAKANPNYLEEDAIQAAMRSAVEEWPCDETASKALAK